MSNEWPHLLADLRNKRDALTAAIDVLEKNFTMSDDDAPAAAPDKPRRGKAAKKSKTGKRALKNGRTDGAKSAPARSAEPP